MYFQLLPSKFPTNTSSISNYYLVNSQLLPHKFPQGELHGDKSHKVEPKDLRLLYDIFCKHHETVNRAALEVSVEGLSQLLIVFHIHKLTSLICFRLMKLTIILFTQHSYCWSVCVWLPFLLLKEREQLPCSVPCLQYAVLAHHAVSTLP